ncbi:MAG TPA: hypothetical protein VF062_18600 [Candidatus Limnocylindrales bacterium]
MSAPNHSGKGQKQVIAKEVKRRTDKVHQDMSEVIVNGGPLMAVARGVQDVNETLAIHAAWTEERFDVVEERLGGLELGQKAIREDIAGLTVKVDSIDAKVDGLTGRVGNLEISSVGMRAEMAQMETRLQGSIDRLAVRMDQVISFAVKDELKLKLALAEAEGEQDTQEK